MIYDVYVKLVVSGHPPIWPVSDVPVRRKKTTSTITAVCVDKTIGKRPQSQKEKDEQTNPINFFFQFIRLELSDRLHSEKASFRERQTHTRTDTNSFVGFLTENPTKTLLVKFTFSAII